MTVLPDGPMAAPNELDFEGEMARFLLGEPDAIAWPYPMYDKLRGSHPVFDYRGGPAIVLSRHRDVKRVMGDGERISGNGYRHGKLAKAAVSHLPDELHELFYKVTDFASLFMTRTDGEQHSRLRRIASRAFTPRRVGLLKESVTRHVDELIEGLRAADVADVKQGLADQLPLRVVTDLLGVPAVDRDMIWEWTGAIASNFSMNSSTLIRASEAIRSFEAYVHDLVLSLRGSDRTELVNLLLDGRDGEALTEDELVAMFVLLLFAGSETTTNLIGAGFHALQQNREQWEMICADPGLVRSAVEESLRYQAPVQYLPRVATADQYFDDQFVEAGDSVIILIAAANRDPDVFAEPDRFDITRPDKAEHLALAFGPHFCLGSSLARLEGQIAFEALSRRFPDARLTDDRVTYTGSAMLRTIESLPTDLGPERR